MAAVDANWRFDAENYCSWHVVSSVCMCWQYLRRSSRVGILIRQSDAVMLLEVGPLPGCLSHFALDTRVSVGRLLGY
jgi:hypothetical protein